MSVEALQIDRGRDTEAVWTDPFLTDPFEANVTTGDEVHRSGDICNNAMMMTSLLVMHKTCEFCEQMLLYQSAVLQEDRKSNAPTALPQSTPFTIRPVLAP
jgi:hypothetical protein